MEGELPPGRIGPAVPHRHGRTAHRRGACGGVRVCPGGLLRERPRREGRKGLSSSAVKVGVVGVGSSPRATRMASGSGMGCGS